MLKKVVLFTDIGEFPDDYGALIYLLSHPEIKVIAMVNSGNKINSDHIAAISLQKKYLEEYGGELIPIFGEDEAVKYIPVIVSTQEEKVYLLSIGSFGVLEKTVSELDKQKLLVTKVKEIFMMAGSYHGEMEWNFSCEFESTKLFFGKIKETQNVRCFIVPFELSKQLELGVDEIRLITKKTSLINDFTKAIIHCKEKYGEAPLCDVVAAMIFANHDKYKWRSSGLVNEMGHKWTGQEAGKLFLCDSTGQPHMCVPFPYDQIDFGKLKNELLNLLK